VKQTQLRYRFEDGQPCVDVRIESVERLFDNRDPAPFRERDLDPDLEQYLRDAGDDLRGRAPYGITFWVDRAPPSGEIEHAFRSYFEDVLERLARKRRLQRSTGHVTLLIAVILLATLLSLAHFVRGLVQGAVGEGLREGLVIAGWVVMWRPVEVLIYDWIPMARERKVITELLQARIDVRSGKGPVAPVAQDRSRAEARG
jgi:hypothetical protein